MKPQPIKPLHSCYNCRHVVVFEWPDGVGIGNHCSWMCELEYAQEVKAESMMHAKYNFDRMAPMNYVCNEHRLGEGRKFEADYGVAMREVKRK